MSTKLPRLTPLAEAEMTDEVRAIVAPSIGGFGRVLNIFATLARHPKLLKRFQLFGALMLSGQLPARERELLILRTAWNCGADYEWGHHDAIGRAVGLTPDEVARVADGPDAPGWDPFDRTLLRAADELHSRQRIGDAVWSTLAQRYDEQQLIELPMLVGEYTMLAYVLNSLQVQRDEGLAAMPRRA
jgi:alkylhydroperoxidase family enzyme